MNSALFWTLASRVSIQAFSFLRVVILARILTPYDFGISASTFIAYQLLDMLTFTGFTTALTAHKGNFKEGYPTLWWSTFIRGLILATILFLFSDSIGDFFLAPHHLPGPPEKPQSQAEGGEAWRLRNPTPTAT
ncbi:MAG: oligosaccharide flippase family protein [candidate division WOR-3 bacterium]